MPLSGPLHVSREGDPGNISTKGTHKNGKGP